jgi:tRNA A37 N6-isopentenylltransferase MiaA
METDVREIFERGISDIERKIEIAGEVIDAKGKELISLKKDLNSKLKAKALWLNEKVSLPKKRRKRISEEKADEGLDQDIKNLSKRQ